MSTDSDSDSEAAQNTNSRPPVKAQIVAERERRVRYLSLMFPKLNSFDVYESLSLAHFDLKVAVEKLTKRHGATDKLVDYEEWKRDEKIKPQMQRNGTGNGVAHGKRNVAQKKTSKAKRRKVNNSDDSNDEIEYYDDRVYDSDEDSDQEISDVVTPHKQRVLDFMQNATPEELLMMHSCSKKKVDAIVGERPFAGWADLVAKLQSNKNLTPDLLNSAQKVIATRNNVKALMNKCSSIAGRLEYAVKQEHAIKAQPQILSQGLKLTSYQLVGLNWLTILHNLELNGILADEMGLGKTVQVISFLAYLKERSIGGLHLVVVPASTLDNWNNEFERWCPSIKVLLYYGNIEERRNYRMMFAKGEHKDYDVVLATYNTVTGSPEDKRMFRVTQLHYVIFDEAHMLKNMKTSRFETLSRIRAKKRLLLTGTPLQNNLLELMSLLTFVMPNIFSTKIDDLKSLFQKAAVSNGETRQLCASISPIPKFSRPPRNIVQLIHENLLVFCQKKGDESDSSSFEKQQIEHAKRIMQPFVLRRLKRDVLKDLPKKTDLKELVPMEEGQDVKYKELIARFQAGISDDCDAYNGMAMMTDLRKLANHPLLLRYHYSHQDLQDIAKHLAKDPDYKDTVVKYIVDDLACMSDYAIHEMTKEYISIGKFSLPKKLIPISGKFQYLDKALPDLKQNGHRVLIFSQYVIMLDILEDYLKMRKHSFLRLDGSTAVTLRQELINEYTDDKSIFVFLLSTRAGGLGINLTAADTVIIHDIDFNPYNDKQAEDRCHRMGQTRPVQVMRLISSETIEEDMWALTQNKLQLERDITSEDNENPDVKSVVSLLSSALRVDQNRVNNVCSPEKMKINGRTSM